MTTLADDAQAAHAQRVADNEDQVRLAEHLISTARDRLAGRDDDGRELLDIRPAERIVLGLVQPQPRPLLVTPASPAAVPHEPGVPVDHLPASEMGLTALVRCEGDALQLDVVTRFALYLQHLPTHQQQAERSGIVDDEDPGPVDERGSDDDPIGPDAAPVTSEPTSSAPPAVIPEEPTPEALAALPPDVAAALQATVRAARNGTLGMRVEIKETGGAADRESGGDGQDTAPRPGRNAPGPSDFLRLVYRRYDVEVTHRLVVPVPTDARPHTVSEEDSYQRAISAVITPATAARTGVYAGSLFVPMRGRSAVRIPRAVVVAGPVAHEQHLRSQARTNWAMPVPQISFRATVQRTPDGTLRLAVTLVNETPQPERDLGFVPEVSLYDAGFSVKLAGAQVVPSEYRVVERDYRTEPLVYAHGRFCCLDEEAYRATGELRTTTLPLHRQLVYDSKPELQPSFDALAADPVHVLEEVARHMAQFADSWDTYLQNASLTPVARAACETDRAAFADEIRRFSRGLALIRQDLTADRNGIGEAFVRANQAFSLMNRRGGLNRPGEATITTWRLFQIVYIVSSLPALAAREAPAHRRTSWASERAGGRRSNSEPTTDLDELDVADVLWFPTGGGKSAALYGITAVALFYDRLRGKDAGVTTIIRFPLRMLSVQQLERVLRLVAACERIRAHHREPGEPFRLGYWVGRSNTPNKITNPIDERWHDVAWMARQSDDWKRENTVVPSCPYCGGSDVALAPDPEQVLIQHQCRTCDEFLPVDISDDEVYRHLPAVVVCTVDKIAALAHSAHASHLTHGPAWRCPDHGYVTHPQGRDRRCLARQRCTRKPADWRPVSIKDPAPALVIQDELHLLSEELGTFAAHYETLWQHLCTVGSGLPSKILAATATISDYENQVIQLYALRPRRFPTDGWNDGESFYAQRHDDLVRRIFVGALPTQMDVVQFSLAAGEAIRGEVARLADMPGDIATKTLGLTATSPDEVRTLLFQYELQCFYCNRKTHADRVHARAERDGRNGYPPFQSVRLNGQTRLAEISEVIRRVERETSTTARQDRLACIAGTSLISHGVDLERLNLLFVLGMPSTVAYYVQATSRAGRTDVGIVFTVLARHYVRDRSVFHFFEPQHRYVNVLVEPVALNRFSTHGPHKTASGLLAAILIQQWARDVGLLAASGADPVPTDLTMADATRRLLARMRARAEAGTGPDPVLAAQRDVKSGYGLRAAVLDPHVSQRFAETVDRQVANVLTSIDAAHEALLTRSMRPWPPTSLRDVDASADFGAVDYPARRRFEFLGGLDHDDDATDYTIAEEED